MFMSTLLGERYKEKPADAALASHVFLLRGGYIRQVAGGLYTLLPPALRVVRKLETIVRQEMDEITEKVALPLFQ